MISNGHMPLGGGGGRWVPDCYSPSSISLQFIVSPATSQKQPILADFDQSALQDLHVREKLPLGREEPELADLIPQQLLDRPTPAIEPTCH